MASDEAQELFSDGTAAERMINAVEEVVYIFDTEGTIIDYNDRFVEITGYAPGEIDRMKAWEFIAAADREAVTTRISEILEHGERVRVDAHLLTETGETIPYEFTGSPLYEGDEIVGFVGIGRDISERQERQQELKTAKRRLDIALDATDTGVWNYNSETDAVVPNDNTKRLFGIEDEFEGSLDALLEYVHPADRETLSEAIQGVLDTDGNCDVAIRIRDTARWLSIKGEQFSEDGTDRVIGTVTDITDQKERARKREAQQTALRRLHEITATTAPFEEKMTELLEYGREYLGVEQGFFTRVTQETQEIIAGAGPNDQLQAGASAPVEESYCQQTIARDETLSIDDASESRLIGEPAIERFGLACYIGTTVYLDGEPYGTLCFADRETQPESFSAVHETFVELIASWASAELERGQRERQYRRLTERITSGYYALDTDWTITYWNDVVAERQGVPAEEIVGENLWEQYPDIKGTEVADTFREAMATGEQTHCEFYYPADDYWTEVQVFPDEDGISVLSTEITERKERERQLEGLVETTDELGYATSPAEVAQQVVAIVDDVLDVVATMYHPDGEQLIPWASTESTEAIDPLGPERPELAAFREGEPRLVESHQREQPDSVLAQPIGEYGLLTVALPEQPISDTERNLLSILANHASAAFERAEREQALETYKNKLEESNENLQEFAYIASHDLQEPLRSVTSYLDLLESEYADDLDGDAQFYIDRATSNASRMSAMIEALLQYSRVETQGKEFVRVDADEVLAETRDSLAVLAEEANAEIAAESLPTVTADERQLGRLFQNLIKNAIEHGGDPPEVTITARDAGDAWEFAVADNGPGIPDKHHDRIFEIFQQATTDDDKGEGGIGLAICERIVSRHHGDIWVETDDSGSTFKFTIPKQ